MLAGETVAEEPCVTKPYQRLHPEVPFQVEPLLAHAAEMIKTQMRARGVSRTQLGRAVGLKPDTVRTFLSLHEGVGLHKLLHIADYLKIEHAQLFGPGLGIDPDLWDILWMLMQVPQEMRQGVRTILHAHPTILALEARLAAEESERLP